MPGAHGDTGGRVLEPPITSPATTAGTTAATTPGTTAPTPVATSSTTTGPAVPTTLAPTVAGTTAPVVPTAVEAGSGGQAGEAPGSGMGGLALGTAGMLLAGSATVTLVRRRSGP